MAMNKREQAELAAAKLNLGMARAVIFRTEQLPTPMGPHKGPYGSVTVGWCFNAHTGEVRQGCFDSIYSSWHSTTKTDRQGAGTFYATREEALIVMREEMAIGFAKRLAAVDAEIEHERAKSKEAA